MYTTKIRKSRLITLCCKTHTGLTGRGWLSHSWSYKGRLSLALESCQPLTTEKTPSSCWCLCPLLDQCLSQPAQRILATSLSFVYIFCCPLGSPQIYFSITYLYISYFHGIILSINCITFPPPRECIKNIKKLFPSMKLKGYRSSSLSPNQINKLEQKWENQIIKKLQGQRFYLGNFFSRKRATSTVKACLA